MNQKPTLADYLNGNALNISIHKLLKAEHPGLFDHFEFFHFLYEWYDRFENNQENYFFIETEFNKIEEQGLRRFVFFHYLIEVIKFYNNDGDGELYFSPAGDQSFGYIYELYEEIKEELYPEEGQQEPESIVANGSQDIDVQLDNNSNSRLVLIFYYFLKNAGLELRKEIDVAPVAKFMHLTTGKEFKGTTSSDFYQKLLKAPNIKKTEKETIKDLEAIKPLFQKVQLNEIVALIDKEIELAKSESKSKK